MCRAHTVPSKWEPCITGASYRQRSRLMTVDPTDDRHNCRGVYMSKNQLQMVVILPNDKNSSVTVHMINNEGNVAIENVVVLCVCGM